MSEYIHVSEVEDISFRFRNTGAIDSKCCKCCQCCKDAGHIDDDTIPSHINPMNLLEEMSSAFWELKQAMYKRKFICDKDVDLLDGDVKVSLSCFYRRGDRPALSPEEKIELIELIDKTFSKLVRSR